MRKKPVASKKQKISKKSVRAIEWILLLSAIFGARTSTKSEEKEDAPKPKTEQTAETHNKPNSDVQEKNPFVNAKPEVVIDKNTVHGLLNHSWNDIAIGLTELETYRKKPVVQQGESRATRGPGVTWNYFFNNDSLVRLPGTVSEAVLSYDDNYMQLAYHLEYETLGYVIRAVNDTKNITDRQKVALVWAAYQRPADVKHIVEKLKKAKTPQQIADAFMAGNIPANVWEGTMKRRWFCGAYAAGLIDTKDILNMRRDAFTACALTDIKKGKHFKLDDKTVQKVLSGKNENNTVRQFLSQFDTGRKMLAGKQVAFPEWKINKKYETEQVKKSASKKSGKAQKKKADKKVEKKSEKKVQKKTEKKTVKKAPKRSKSKGMSAPKKKQTTPAKKKADKKRAFTNAAKEIENKAYSADLIKMKLARDNKSMA